MIVVRSAGAIIENLNIPSTYSERETKRITRTRKNAGELLMRRLLSKMSLKLVPEIDHWFK
jgi:hypothetical protein